MSEERGVTGASIGLIQLILDKLNASCIDENGSSIEFPSNVDLLKFDMKTFIRSQILNKVSGYSIEMKRKSEMSLDKRD